MAKERQQFTFLPKESVFLMNALKLQLSSWNAVRKLFPGFPSYTLEANDTQTPPWENPEVIPYILGDIP